MGEIIPWCNQQTIMPLSVMEPHTNFHDKTKWISWPPRFFSFPSYLSLHCICPFSLNTLLLIQLIILLSFSVHFNILKSYHSISLTYAHSIHPAVSFSPFLQVIIQFLFPSLLLSIPLSPATPKPHPSTPNPTPSLSVLTAVLSDSAGAARRLSPAWLSLQQLDGAAQVLEDVQWEHTLSEAVTTTALRSSSTARRRRCRVGVRCGWGGRRRGWQHILEICPHMQEIEAKLMCPMKTETERG